MSWRGNPKEVFTHSLLMVRCDMTNFGISEGVVLCLFTNHFWARVRAFECCVHFWVWVGETWRRHRHGRQIAGSLCSARSRQEFARSSQSRLSQKQSLKIGGRYAFKAKSQVKAFGTRHSAKISLYQVNVLLRSRQEFARSSQQPPDWVRGNSIPQLRLEEGMYSIQGKVPASRKLLGESIYSETLQKNL